MFHKLERLFVCCAIFVTLWVAGTPTAAQPQSSPATPPLTTPTPSAAGALTLEQRITLLEQQMNVALALKEEKIQDVKDRVESLYKQFQYLLAIASVLLVFFSIRDVVIRSREGQRQRSIDDIVKDTMKLQHDAIGQQVRFGAIQLSAAEKDPALQFQPVKSVSDVIEVVQKTLAFRLEQEQKVADTIKKIDQMEANLERTRKLRFESATGILDHFKGMNRMQFATLTEEQHGRAIKLLGLVGDLDEFLEGKGFEIAGDFLYTCGVIAFYDNDVIEALTYLDRAAKCRAADHEAEQTTNERYRTRFAFIHYFRALIQKNWGDLPEALHEIEQSDKLLADRATEYLTPVTKAEILSYIVGDEPRCRLELAKLIDRMEGLETSLRSQGKKLDANQVRLRNRMLLLLGNAYFVGGNHREALVQYRAALQFNEDDYYALGSVAQCLQILGEESPVEYFERCLNSIEHSGDLRRKRERIVRAVIAVLAASAAKGCNSNRYDEYFQEASEMLSGNLTVDGLSPKFFSPATKRLVSSADLLKELGTVVASSSSSG
ncbi:MAG: hypothetical protein ACHQZS_02090 [Candidatus Binatales bacterium]